MRTAIATQCSIPYLLSVRISDALMELGIEDGLEEGGGDGDTADLT